MYSIFSLCPYLWVLELITLSRCVLEAIFDADEGGVSGEEAQSDEVLSREHKIQNQRQKDAVTEVLPFCPRVIPTY